MEQALFNLVYGVGTPLLRLLLVPIDDFPSFSYGFGAKLAVENVLKPNSIENHFVDNIEVDLKFKSCGLVDYVNISFLLEDRSLLQTHCGLVIEQANSIPVFLIGKFSERPTEVEVFNQPYPWNNYLAPSPNATENVQLVAESCFESQVDYNIRLQVHAKDKPLSGKPKD